MSTGKVTPAPLPHRKTGRLRPQKCSPVTMRGGCWWFKRRQIGVDDVVVEADIEGVHCRLRVMNAMGEGNISELWLHINRRFSIWSLNLS